MDVLTYTHTRQHLADIMDKVCEDQAPVMISRRAANNVVMMSQEEFEALQETLHLLRSPRNAERLLGSMADADAGRVEAHDLIEE